MPSGLDLVRPTRERKDRAAQNTQVVPNQAKEQPSTHLSGAKRLPRIGERFDDYEIVALLGKGNMGKIYRARDSLGRDVALKVILTEVANEEGLARFEREGQALAAIPWHKGIVQVHSTGTIRRMPYLTMDYVEGQSLEDILKEGPLPLKQAGVVAEKLAKALQHVHDAGVMHRDLKPANVLIRNDNGEPVLTDFGLAGMSGAQSLTQTGDLLGTPLYMAPEQVLGLNKKVDHRADVWGLGVLLYEMLTGTVPFPGSSMVEVCNAITNQEPLPITNLVQDADAMIVGILDRALAKDKEDRYSSPGELAAALKAWRRARRSENPPPPAVEEGAKRLPLLIGVGVMVLAGLGLGVFALVKARERSKLNQSRESEASKRKAEDELEEQNPADRALGKANLALDKGDVEGALRTVELREIRDQLQGHPRLLPLRAKAIAMGLELTEGDLEVDRLRPLLQLVGFLNSIVSDPPGPELADAIIEKCHAADDANMRQLSQRTADLYKALSRSGLRPSYLAARRALDDYPIFGRFSHQASFQRRYYDMLLAVIRMDLPLGFNHLYGLRWEGWGERPRRSQGPREAFLQARLEYLRISRNDGLDHAAKSVELRPIYAEVIALTRDHDAARLGPTTRASCLHFLLSNANDEKRHDPSYVAMLEEAVELAPEHLELLAFAAEFCAKRALGLARLDRLPEAREEIQRACDHADAALAFVESQGLEELTSVTAECLKARKHAIQLNAAVGKPERVKAIEAGLPKSLHQRDRVLRELQSAQKQGATWNVTLFGGQAAEKAQ